MGEVQGWGWSDLGEERGVEEEAVDGMPLGGLLLGKGGDGEVCGKI